MNFKSKDETLMKIIFLAGFFMMAFACFVLYTFFLGRYAILFVLSIAFTALYTYSFTSYFHSKNTEKQTKELTKGIQNLTQHDADFEYIPTDDKNFEAAFSAVAMTKNILEIREGRSTEIRRIIRSIPLNANMRDMLKELLPRLAAVTDSNCCAFYLSKNEKLVLKYSIGFGKNIYKEFDTTMGEGLIGAAAMQNEITIINNIPDDTEYIFRTVLGDIKPKAVMAVPVHLHDNTIGILLFAGLQEYSEMHLEFLDEIGDYLRVLVLNSRGYEEFGLNEDAGFEGFLKR
ncbi:MAG: GAF domain-containing protein [Defluviitaleaceae bacterium]|nr:GAF domain-containing protein [Defluviitaleaceae bacterium]